MGKEPSVALLVQHSLAKYSVAVAEHGVLDKVLQQLPSRAVGTICTVSAGSRPNPKGWESRVQEACREVSESIRGFSVLALFGLVKMGKTVLQRGCGRAWSIQSFSCPRSCLPFLPLPHLFDHSRMVSMSLSGSWSFAALVSLLLQLLVSGMCRMAEREEGSGLLSCSRIVSEVTVRTTAGGSALVLFQSLSDKTLLSLQVKR